MSIDTASLDATLETLRKHKVAVFKSEAFSVEFDAAAFEGEREAELETPGADEAASIGERRKNIDTLLRSAR